MRLPFTVEQFLAVFARYNEAIWPAQLGAYALALVALALAVRGGRAASVVVAWLLAGAWGFVGVAYHLASFAEVNPAARAFGAAFLLQAALFAAAGWRERLAFGWSASWRAGIGLALVAYAMVGYPLLGAALGQAYPATPVFGVTPCPTAIFTFGLLLVAVRPAPAWLLVVPVLWAAIATSAAVQLGMREDLGLTVAAAISIAAGVLARTRRARLGGRVAVGR